MFVGMIICNHIYVILSLIILTNGAIDPIARTKNIINIIILDSHFSIKKKCSSSINELFFWLRKIYFHECGLINQSFPEFLPKPGIKGNV